MTNRRAKFLVKLLGCSTQAAQVFRQTVRLCNHGRMSKEQAGAKVLLVSWLKTINTGYHVLQVNKNFDPYEPQTFGAADVKITSLPYSSYIVDKVAPTELSTALQLYRKKWRFPE